MIPGGKMSIVPSQARLPAWQEGKKRQLSSRHPRVGLAFVLVEHSLVAWFPTAPRAARIMDDIFPDTRPLIPRA